FGTQVNRFYQLRRSGVVVAVVVGVAGLRAHVGDGEHLHAAVADADVADFLVYFRSECAVGRNLGGHRAGAQAQGNPDGVQHAATQIVVGTGHIAVAGEHRLRFVLLALIGDEIGDVPVVQR